MGRCHQSPGGPSEQRCCEGSRGLGLRGPGRGPAEVRVLVAVRPPTVTGCAVDDRGLRGRRG